MAFAKVQSGLVGSGSLGQLPMTLSSPSTKGNLLIASFSSTNGSSAFSGPPGWKLAKAQAQGSAFRTEMWYYPYNPGNISSATFSQGATGTTKGVIREFSSSTGTIQLLNAGAAGSNGTTGTTYSVTTGGANATGDLGIFHVANAFSSAPNSSFSIPSSWTRDNTVGNSVQNFAAYSNLSLASGSTQTLAPTFGTSTNETAWAAVFATFTTSVNELAENGTGTDAFAAVPHVSLAESGTGTDTFSVHVAATLAEAGTGASSFAVHAFATLAESGHGTDSAAVAVQTALAEAGHGTETFSPSHVPLPEAGRGSDSFGVTAHVSVTDAGTGSDAFSASHVPGTEAGHGSDSFGVSVTAFAPETGHGADAFRVGVDLGAVETGHGEDSFEIIREAALPENEITAVVSGGDDYGAVISGGDEITAVDTTTMESN